MIKIALGDLRHKTLGRHSSYMPLGIALVASYCQSRFGDNVEIRLYEDPEKIFRDVDNFRPDVIGLSNYMWNTELNRLVLRHAKKRHPGTITICGGPHFPIKEGEIEYFLRNRLEIDFYSLLEGELAFSDLIGKLLTGCASEEIKSMPIPGLASLSPVTKSLVSGGIHRIENLNIIPSPYLSGLMESWFDGAFVPVIQTARGCPYTCSYCRASADAYGRIMRFDLDRIKEELNYIAKRIHLFPNVGLLIVDSNFGITERDEDIAQHVRTLQDKYGWPQSILADTAKNNYDRVFRISSILQNKLPPLCSLQTLNEETLKIIKRQNLPYEQYIDMQKKLVSMGFKPATELIIPLPRESQRSFLETLKKVFCLGVENITVFTLMLLPGSELACEDMRKRYDMKTGWRIIPRQFGLYEGAACFEMEEICYETSTMTFEEYVQCRGFAFLCFLFAGSQYNIFKRLLRQFELDEFDFLQAAFEQLPSMNSAFAELYKELLQKTRHEIFETPEDLQRFYLHPENYQKLLRGEIGDNLFRNYLVRVLLEGFQDSLNFIYAILHSLLSKFGRMDHVLLLFVEETKKWMRLACDFSAIFQHPKILPADTIAEFFFDIPEWLREGEAKESVEKYRIRRQFRFYYEETHISNLMSQSQLLYGNDTYFSLGRMLTHYPADVFFRKVQVADTGESKETTVNKDIIVRTDSSS